MYTPSKEELYHNLLLSPLHNDSYIVMKDYFFENIRVHKGYVTNGANIPRWLWSFYPPNRSAYMPAVVIHDYLCEKKQFKKADRTFKKMLEILEISPFTVFMFYHGVRLYHVIKYNK